MSFLYLRVEKSTKLQKLDIFKLTDKVHCMKLIIVESPTKSRTLQNFLGKEYDVQSSFGHVRDLPKGRLGIDVEHDFTPKYVIPTKARKVVTFLKKEAKKADSVILATDEDREGEAIAWHLAQVLDLGNSKSEIRNPKPVQRIVFHEITKEAIENALKNPRAIDENRVHAQQGRRILDRLVGYELSPFLWQKVARGLSAGRVQSVAVRLIADREKEIKAFIAQEYWSIEAVLKKIQDTKYKIQDTFTAFLSKKDGKTIGKLDIRSKEQADEILKNLEKAEYRVATIEQKQVKRNPFPPFTTSTLQQEASKKLHFPAKFTMSLAQQLYEMGLITYHRTDSLNLSEYSLGLAKEYIIKTYGNSYWPGSPRRFKTKSKGAQEAHEAIRPTLTEPISKKLTPPQIKLYDLVRARFLASQMSQAIFASTVIEIQAVPLRGISRRETKNYIFRASGQMLQFDGFLKVYPIKFEETELPILLKDETLDLKKLIPAQHFTEPPPRYTEASLIKTLEENEIGRPSTYASITSTIQERGYIEKDEQKRFYPTELGIRVNNMLVQHFPQIVDIQFTAGMEEKLDNIAKGKEQWVPMIKDFFEPFQKNLKKKYQEVQEEKVAPEATDKKCPTCNSPLVIRKGRFGKFYACSTYPACKFTESLEQKNVSLLVLFF